MAEGSFFNGDGFNLDEDGIPKNGRVGLWTSWYGNGQMKGERTFKDGKPDGLRTVWYENGQKKLEGTWKDGDQVGLFTQWDKNGQKKEGGIYKNDVKIKNTIWTYYLDGQKESERTYKDGKEGGLWFEWNVQDSIHNPKISIQYICTVISRTLRICVVKSVR